MDTSVSKSCLSSARLAAHKAGHLDMVRQGGLELKKEHSSQNERQKCATWKDLPRRTMKATS